MNGQQGLNRALYQVAGRSLDDCQFDLAIRCLVAVLENEPDPDDFAQCSLDLARIYIDYTEDTDKAQEKLLQLVRCTACDSDGAWCFVRKCTFSHRDTFVACPHLSLIHISEPTRPY